MRLLKIENRHGHREPIDQSLNDIFHRPAEYFIVRNLVNTRLDASPLPLYHAEDIKLREEEAVSAHA